MWRDLRLGELDAIAVIDACSDGRAHEVMIDVGAEPVRVRHVFSRAGGDQQPLGIEACIRESRPRMMAIEREPALQSSPNVRVMLEPAAVRREIVAVVETVAPCDSLE